MKTLRGSFKPNANREQHHEETYDIAFVGAGISTSYSILALINQLEIYPPASPLRLAVYDKSGEFWTGVPYGTRSGERLLIITSLREFLPELDREKFISWLRLNWDKATAGRDTAGDSTKRWYQEYRNAIDRGDWTDVFVPRFTFGLYLKSRVEAQLAYAERARLLTCQCIIGEIQGITRQQRGFVLQGKDSKEVPLIPILSLKVVLAPGSPPNKNYSQYGSSRQADYKLMYIEDMYEPSHEINLQEVAHSLSTTLPNVPAEVLVLGSNASALEFIYALLDKPEISDRISRVIVLSPSGEFPQ